MANIDAPFGLRPVGNIGGGQHMTNQFLIVDNEATSIFQGDIVEPDENTLVILQFKKQLRTKIT